ncbi:YybH family protein [Terrimonas pollutisoli]|uniref:YybH family protein n=1 Tax=Terrimonas pollutisoli TaxID=3034147 RepID=UPI0023EAFA31|nr:nuclear transport factor 2 family protein [Terrimonas sp. H1YJ31]
MKQNLSICLLLVASSYLFAGCGNSSAQQNSNLEEAKRAIEESNSIYFQSFAKGDSSIFIERYAEDCCIMAPGAPAMCGPDAPLEFFRLAYHKIGLRNGKFITTNVYGSGDGFVTEEGLWQSYDASNKLFDDGKFLVLWKKTAKGWKMYRDSFSSNRKD